MQQAYDFPESKNIVKPSDPTACFIHNHRVSNTARETTGVFLSIGKHGSYSCAHLENFIQRSLAVHEYVHCKVTGARDFRGSI
mmetsp:Transcript_153859/g.491804  ORF Transcript_153859/g.491804 Transcript_153859/m.491804 type:complete len:83 (+) Transcript_153859:2-250(+)